MKGMSRFLERVWKLRDRVSPVAPDDDSTRRQVHRTTKEVGDRIEAMKFNTAVAALMELVNRFEALPCIDVSHWERLLMLLSPFAPHICEELWAVLGKPYSIQAERWPRYDAMQAKDTTMEVPVQVDGRVRGRLAVPPDLPDIEVEARAREEVAAFLSGKSVRRTVVVRRGDAVSVVNVVT